MWLRLASFHGMMEHTFNKMARLRRAILLISSKENNNAFVVQLITA
jgi:hypothetical protein